MTGATNGSGGLSFTDTCYSDPRFTSPTGYWWTFSGSFTDANYDFVGTLTSDSDGNSGLP